MNENLKEIKDKIEKLKRLIDKYRYNRHVLNKELVPVEVEDSLKRELFELEQKYPQFITPDSPTQRIGGAPLKEFKKIRHEIPMLSFNDAFNFEDIKEWEERNKKILISNFNFNTDQIKNIEYFCELKIDGLAIKLVYVNGILNSSSTRGDGYLGEDVTQNVKTIEAIPLSLLPLEEIIENFKKNGVREEVVNNFLNKYPEKIEIRGEVFMNKKDFEALNKEREKNNEPIFANPRNAASGSLRQLDPQITAERKLDSFAYDLVTNLGQKTHEEEHIILKCLGFKTNPYVLKGKTLEECENFRNYWQEKRDSLDFEIDGIVIQINDNDIFEKLGIVGKAPRGAIAYKFSPKQATTIIEDIIVQVGRTGILTPVAILKPIEVGGVVISRASLHNEDIIKKLDIKIGDAVVVVRSGDVIPQIVKVIKELRTGKEKNFVFPQNCPICKSKVIKEGAYYKCPNKSCFNLNKEKIYHFVSKSGFDIVGLGPKIIDKLLDNNIIQDAADIFFIKPRMLIKLPGFDIISERNILNSINKSKKISLKKFIYALGIPHIGEENSKILADFYSSKGKIEKPIDLYTLQKSISKFAYQSIFGFGPKVIQSIVDWFNDEANLNLINKLTEAGIEIISSEEKKDNISYPLKGFLFCFTGELSTYTRSEAQKIVENLGGITVDNISSKVNYLVVGKNPGSKLDKAKKYKKIKIINEEEFIEILEKAKKEINK